MSVDLLSVEGLSIVLGRSGKSLVEDVSFTVAEGEALGVVGESGSGKTLTMLSLLRLLPQGLAISAGTARFDAQSLFELSVANLRAIRGREIAFIFQDPQTALNPVMTVGRQITEVLRRHFRISKSEADVRAAGLLAKVGVPDPKLRLRQYPHEFSGGMRQRVMIAIAMAGEPRLLIADEPTTALDVTVQAEIVGLVQRLQKEQRMAVIWVTHDLALLARIADRVIVMFAGRMVETATAETLFAAPKHPYTAALLSGASPDHVIVGDTSTGPEIAEPGRGCAFAPRCPDAADLCRDQAPYLVHTGDGACVACWKFDADGARSVVE